MYRYDGKAESLRIQDSELREVRFWTIAELRKELKRNPEKFVPHGKYWTDMMREVEKRVS